MDTYESMRRERDEETRKRYAAERERDEALKAKDEQLEDSERIIAALVKERDEARAEAERLRADHDFEYRACEVARADAARLREALVALVKEAEGWSVHAPDYCSRDEECDESSLDDPCWLHAPDLDGPQTDECPACECGVSRLQAVVDRAREALEEVES